MRRSVLFFWLLIMALGLGVFKVKYQVMALEQTNKQITQSIQTNKEAIHILKAEWSYLNDPKRLEKLSQQYLDLQPVKPAQVITLLQFPYTAYPNNIAKKDKIEKKSLKSQDALGSLLNKIEHIKRN